MDISVSGSTSVGVIYGLKTDQVNLIIKYRVEKFTVHVTVHRDRLLIINPTTQLDALISQIYFWNETLHVSDSSSVHHQEFFTVHTAMLYVIQVF